MDFALFGSLSDEERRRVLASCRRRRFARREVLFHEGDPGDTLHLIDKGRPVGAAAAGCCIGDTGCVAAVTVLQLGGWSNVS